MSYLHPETVSVTVRIRLQPCGEAAIVTLPQPPVREVMDAVLDNFPLLANVGAVLIRSGHTT
jgi:hypothetical protein